MDNLNRPIIHYTDMMREHEQLRRLRRKLVMERRELQSNGRRARADKPKKVRSCT